MNATVVENKTLLWEMSERLLMRRLARRNYLDYAKYVYPGFLTSPHIEHLARALERIESGELHFLVVLMPPRHSKSMNVSQLFPCWYLGRNPEKNILQTGYSEDIAFFHSRHAKEFFASPENKAVFPDSLHSQATDGHGVKDVLKQAVKEWGTVQGGRYTAAGILGGITGRGFDLVIIDDPVKNREEANSAVIRSKTLDQFRSSLYTRLTPNGAVILCMTSWNQDDLGSVLKKEVETGDIENGEVISFPAIAHKKDILGRLPGEALWPEKFNKKWLAAKRKVVGAYEWAALYDCSPRAREGCMFPRANWKTQREAPKGLEMVRFWDCAGTKKSTRNKDPDYSASVLMGTVGDGLYYILDSIKERTTALELENLMEVTAKTDKSFFGNITHRIEQEPGASSKNLISHYQRNVFKDFYDCRGVPSTGSKAVRAGPAEAAVEAGNMMIIEGRWNKGFIDDMEGFENGGHDDVGDCVSGAHLQLADGINDDSAQFGW